MKILSVYLKNLNSIKGEYRISFNEPPLSDTGLFAITGETGAGKSTILDAISLALYNAIPRGSADEEIMTFGTAEAIAEVEFSTSDGVYRATWSKRRARLKSDGNMQGTDRKIADISNSDKEVILAEKIKDVEKCILQITGLDFVKFSQSVLLAQGNFAAFMQAEPKKRGELLEKITKRDEFSRYSIAAFEKHKKEKEILDRQKLELEKHAVLSEEDLEALQQSRQMHVDSIASLRLELENTNKLLNSLENIDKLKEQTDLGFAAYQKAVKEEEGSENLRKTLEKHEKTMIFSEALGELAAIEKTLTENNDLLGKVCVAIPAGKDELAKSEAELLKNIEARKQLIAAYKSQEPLFRKATELDEEIRDHKKTVLRISEELENLQQKIASSKQEIKEKKYALEQKQKEKEANALWLNTHRHYASIPEIAAVLKTRIATYTKQAAVFEEKKEKYAKRLKQLELLNAEMLSKALSHNTYQNEYSALQQQLSELLTEKKALKAGEDTDAVSEKLASLVKNAADASRLLEIAESYRQILDETRALEKNIFSLNEKRKTGLEAKAQKEADIKRTEELLQSVSDNCQFQHLIKNYEEDRKKLVPGKECFVCGSKAHPWFIEMPEIKLNEYEKQKKEVESSLKKQGKELLDIANNTPSAEQIALASSSLEKLKEKSESHQKRFSEIRKENQNIEASIEKTDELTILCKQFETERDALIGLEASLKKIEAKIQKTQEVLVKKKEQGSQLELEISKLESEINNLQDNTEAEKMELAEIEDVITETSESIQKQIQPFSLVFSAKSPDENLKILEAYRLDYEQRQRILTNLDNTCIGLQSEINTAEKALDVPENKDLPAKQKVLADINFSMKAKLEERKSVLGGLMPADITNEHEQKLQALDELIVKKQKLFNDFRDNLRANEQKQAELERAIAKLAVENQQKTQEVLRKAEGDFSSLAEIKAARINDTEYDVLKRRIKEILDNVTKAKAAHLQSLSQWEQEVARLPENTEKDALLLEKARLLEAEALYNKELAAVNVKLLRNEELREEKAGLLKEIDAQTRELLRWEALNELIGSANGDKFRKYAQSITLRLLADKANSYLETISGRYRLILQPEKQKITNLELDICDAYQGDNIRPMNTLSGGETFLASLSLALGLSDMVGGEFAVESLFIDEGFGSLDPEALDVALSALENLQSTGKTIGIISHVEQLKDRIPSQIQVRKKGGGVSEIVVV